MPKRKRRDRSLRNQYAGIAAKGGLGRQAAGGATDEADAHGYSGADLAGVPAGSVEMGLGCGNPTALAGLAPGEVVLDLGSGGGMDAFIAARKVGPAGRVIGVDTTPEMVEKGARFAEEGGFRNIEFRLGRIERLPLPDGSVDVVISNCVINHASDKLAAFREALRVLRPGGRMCIADLVVEGPIPPTDDPGMEVWRAWLAVACGMGQYLAAVEKAGFRDIAFSEAAYAGRAMIPALEGRIISLRLTARKPKA